MKIVIIKKDGSEEHSTYQEYAEKLSNSLKQKRFFSDEDDYTPEQWMEYFAGELDRKRLYAPDMLERYAKITDDTIVDIIWYHQWKLDKLRELIIAKTVERIGDGDKEFIVEYNYPDESDDGFGGCVTARREYSIRDMLEELYDEDRSWRRGPEVRRGSYPSSSIRNIKTEKGLLDSFADHLSNNDCFVKFIGSEEDYRKLEQKRRREELEGLASEIAHKHKVGVRSIEFLKAVQKEIDAVDYESEQWNNPECRMEEWAAVRYNGLGADVYFDDLNYVNGKIGSRMDDLHGIMEWMAENCPMLYAQYQEESKEDDETELESELLAELESV